MVSDVPFYLFIIILLSPLIFSSLVSIFILTYVKKIHRQQHKFKPWSYKQSLCYAMLIGIPTAILFQLTMQGFLSEWIYFDENNRYNLSIVAAFCAPWFMLFGYSAILWWCKPRHPLIYEYFRCRHPRPPDNDDEYWDDGDFTVRRSELNGNDVAEE